MKNKSRVGVIAVGFAIVVGLMIALAAVGLLRLESLRDQTDRMLSDSYDAAGEALGEAAREHWQTTRDMLLLATSFIVLASAVGFAVVRSARRDRDALVAEIAARSRMEMDLRQVQANLEDTLARRTDELSRYARRLATAQRIGQMGYWEWEVGTDTAYWSDEVYSMFGLERIQVQPSHALFLRLVHPDDREAVSSALRRAVEQGAPYAVEYRAMLDDGRVRTVHSQGEVSRDESGRPERMIGTIRDVSDARESEQRLWHLAHHDPLSGLPNRSLLYTTLQQAMARAKRGGQEIAVAVLDLDGFKQVNDTLGHAAGDQLIIHVAGMLKAAVRESDVVARLAGDEFVLLLEGIAERRDAEHVVEKVLDALYHAPMRWRDAEVTVSASVGVAFYPGDADDLDHLLNRADAAMYRAKSEGRAGYRVYRRDEMGDANLPLPLD